MKTLYFILLSLLLLNCNNHNSNTATTDTKAVADSTTAKTTDSFSDLSVYTCQRYGRPRMGIT